LHLYLFDRVAKVKNSISGILPYVKEEILIHPLPILQPAEANLFDRLTWDSPHLVFATIAPPSHDASAIHW
jgi:hypothetical protein